MDSQPSAVVECPSPEVLVGFGQGELVDPAFETVASHLSRCDRCLAIVADLHARSTADFFEERVRDCLVAPEFRATVTHADKAWSPTVSEASPAIAAATAPAVKADPWVGEKVGRYQILKRLGVGGMGVVYLAEDPAVGRAVALKMISAEALAKPDRRGRFGAEGRALARVRHPNVVQFHHFDEHAGQPYYTMEYVPGAALADRLPDHPLPVREAAELVRTLAVAVHAVHEQGVIHRDIKPSNILIMADGTPKIADFGLAKLTAVNAQSERTQTGMVLGTPSYMAPEQAEGRIRDIDARADVYALGAVLYATLAGDPPHRGKTIRDTLRLVTGAVPAPLSRLRPEVPKALERICDKCLEKSPGRRYPTAKSLADDLDDYLAARPPRGLPGPIQRALRPTRRQALVAGLGLAATAAGVMAYRSDPDVILGGITADLRAGRAVTLIGKTGQPKWSRWLAGRSKGKPGTGDDGVFTVKVGDDAALIELVPDPQTDSYRLSAEVRHDAAQMRTMSDVGLFVARQHFPDSPGEICFYLQFAYNDIRSEKDNPLVFVNGVAQTRRAMNVINLHPRLFADPTGPVRADRNYSAATQLFLPAGETEPVWRSLEVTVTPAGVAATWEGQPVALTATAVTDDLGRDSEILRADPGASPVIRNLSPAFTPRGGLGLFVAWGTASFRSVTITPLTQKESING